MTGVAGIVSDGTVWIGADSAGVSGSSLAVRADPKVFRLGDCVLGFTTSFRMGQLIRYRLEIPPAENGTDVHAWMCTAFTDALRGCLKDGGWATKEDDREKGGNFLVGVRGRLFEVFSDYQVAEREEPFTATGCGEDFILGSLHTTADLGWTPENRILAALQAAERFSTGVQGPFRIVSAGDPQQ